MSDITTTSRPADSGVSTGVGIRLDGVTKVYPGQERPAVDHVARGMVTRVVDAEYSEIVRT